MTSLSLAKFKSYLTLGGLDNGQTNYRGKSAKYVPPENLVPEVGFQLTLDPGNCNNYRHSIGTTNSDSGNKDAVHRVPELIVRVNGARHLPSNFGIKSVEGYVVKVIYFNGYCGCGFFLFFNNLKVKLFPGSLRFDTSIQTCSWPTFNENFKFPLDSTTK